MISQGLASKVTAGLTKVSWNAVATGRVLAERGSRWVQCPGSEHVAIPQFMDVDKQMEFFIVYKEKHLYTAWAKVCILVPRASHCPVFECLQYSKREGEGLINFIL